MRDGKSLAADVFLPPAAGRYPVILIQTPYGKHRFGSEVGEAAEDARNRKKWPGRYDRANYAYVVVDWRGFYASKDAATGMAQGMRGRDGFDCVEWAAAQPWCDGKVGTWGGSALGKQQFDTAAEKPPHLVCCVPLIACMGQRYEFYYSGGVYREAHVKTMSLLGYAVSKVRESPLPTDRIWSFARRFTYRPAALDVPMLFVTGWWDHFPDEILDMFADVREKSGTAARKHSRIIVGPWTHTGVDQLKQGGLEFPDALDVEKKASMTFFDYWLRGKKDNGWDKTPSVRYYRAFDYGEGGSGRWVGCGEWPGVAVEKVKLFLHASGAISREEPREAAEASPLTRTYRHDPRHPTPTLGGANLPPLASGPTDQSALETRPDVLVYSTGPLAMPIRLLGNAEVSLSFTVNRVDADFCMRLCDADSSGNSFLVADGITRAKFRNGGKQELLEPGKPYSLTIRLPATAYTFRKGRMLKIYLSSSNHPRFERNPHTGEDSPDPSGALDLEAVILHDREHPSSMVLPVKSD